jgi:hypothetical protein
MTDGEDANLVAWGHEAIEDDVAGASERDDELAQLALDDPPHKGVVREEADRLLDRRRRGSRGRRIVLGEVTKRALEVSEGVGGVDYRRQGLGRGARVPVANRSSQP